MLTVDTSELKAFAAEIAAAAGRVEPEAIETMRDVVEDAEDLMREAAPVLTGTLRGSIRTTWHGPLSATVGPHTDYDEYVEGGTSDTAPQPFVGPTADVVTVTAPSAFDRMLGDLLW